MRSTRPRGFSLRELGLTLLLLAVVIVVALRLIDLRTKLLVVEKDQSGLEGVLDVAVRALSRDVGEAARGGVARRFAVRPVADNAEAEGSSSYLDLSGARLAVRPGTDQIGLRGAMRTALVALRFRETAGTSGAVPGAAGAGASAPVWFRVSALLSPGANGKSDTVRGIADLLDAKTARAKRFFLVTGPEGRSTVGVVRDWRRVPGSVDALELRLDFGDPEAVRLGREGSPDAAPALSDRLTGGLLDDVVWFVARGAAGAFPDYNAAVDPVSMRFPHPFLARAEFAGDGRWEIARVAEDVEDLQVAWGLGEGTAVATWQGAAPGDGVPKDGSLADPGAKRRLVALKFALTVKAESRFVRADGPPPPLESAPLLNAPAPGSVRDVAPVGWDPDESRRVPFERATREFVVPVSAADPSGPVGTPRV